MLFKLRLVDRYLGKEFLKPFIFSIFTLTVLMISSYLFELTDLILVKQVPLNKVLKLLLYKIPGVMVQSFAISILFATLLSLSQLVKKNEVIAFRMGGVSLQRLLLPFLIVALVVSISTFFINEQLVPWTNHRAENIVRRIILKQGLPDLKEGSFFKGLDKRYFYIGKIDEQEDKFYEIMLYELAKDKKFPRLITAKMGYFKDKVWHLVDGLVNKFNQQGELIYQSAFKELKINVNQKLENFYGQQKTTSEMSREELLKDIKLFKESGLDVSSLLVDYHLKLAKPFACFIFVLIGAPLTVRSKQGRIFGVIASIVIVFLYYVILSFSRSLGRNGLLNPLLAAWLPNLIFSVIGIYLIIKEEL
ncbi:putative permease [Halobacteroides halobius DSM 5150]|uniref:Putative permease n=1 Tax=Halobacteroides halobius (strain ATCC 35273 / DSM 5150 / MD-1) TaxID=748449 RepID=L0KD81_HALHC|nr:LptF/LptG family permease [Halobacteroides halobius]AGB42309.1 putative permease [Halobacteroides halobius DSM 5150]